MDEEEKGGTLSVLGGKIDDSLDDSSLKLSYVVRVMTCLSGMREEQRGELGLILKASSRQCRRISKVYGLWGNSDDGFLCYVKLSTICSGIKLYHFYCCTLMSLKPLALDFWLKCYLG